MKKKIIIDNDTKKIVNDEIYKEHLKSKSKIKYIVSAIVLIILLLILSWTFINLYKSVNDNDFLKGNWSCNNNVELEFDSFSYKFEQKNIVRRGSYTLTKTDSKNEYKYYHIKITGDENQDFIIIRNNNNILITNNSNTINLSCIKK